MTNEYYVKRMKEFFDAIKDFLGPNSDEFQEFRRFCIESES
jgi:hypothetical protein